VLTSHSYNSCRLSALQALHKAVNYFSRLSGAWAEVVCAKHMILLINAMAVDKNPNAEAGSITMLYHVYEDLAYRWFMEWERGGMQPPGGSEAALDGRHTACRPIPEHYRAVRDLLIDIRALAAQKDRQAAASEAVASMLFAVGDYDNSKKVLQWNSIINEERSKIR